MTENNTQAAQNQPQDGEQATPAPTPPAEPPQAQEQPPAGSEAKLRKRAQEAEAARDTLATQLQALQRAEVERLAAAHVAVPAGLWAAGVNLADLLTEEGTVNAEAVEQAATSAREALGLGAPKGWNPHPVIPGQGDTPDVSPTQRASWGAALGMRPDLD